MKVSDPALPLHAATKQYVDGKVGWTLLETKSCRYSIGAYQSTTIKEDFTFDEEIFKDITAIKFVLSNGTQSIENSSINYYGIKMTAYDIHSTSTSPIGYISTYYTYSRTKEVYFSNVFFGQNCTDYNYSDKDENYRFFYNIQHYRGSSSFDPSLFLPIIFVKDGNKYTLYKNILFNSTVSSYCTFTFDLSLYYR